MITTMEATFDGEMLRLDEPLELEPNTRVRITIEKTGQNGKKARTFLKTARSLRLQGPTDWSARIEDYLSKKTRMLKSFQFQSNYARGRFSSIVSGWIRNGA